MCIIDVGIINYGICEALALVQFFFILFDQLNAFSFFWLGPAGNGALGFTIKR